ncbi:MAG: hydroxyacid dehydrogenase/reductase-like protein [Firmicutes bacterium]|nr:hydroxyacid dehydrogenase/reductase-like protein [Bacillota bacterium]
MREGKIHIKEVLHAANQVNRSDIDTKLQSALQQFHGKIVVLDDDPTGVQTVHGVSVYTDWSAASIEEGFQEESSMFFILTNSRGLTRKETEQIHREIALQILMAAKKCKKEFIIISRSDSTLRGHYPLETQIIKETIESNSDIRFHGEIILPFFQEGGRFTLDGMHYIQEGDYLIPVGETEFAKDKTFGYVQSHLGKWVEEKCNGEYKAADMEYIPIQAIGEIKIDSIVQQLLKVNGFHKVIVDAIDNVDVKIFTIALLKALQSGRYFIFRTAAAFPKVIGNIADKELLLRKDVMLKENQHGGLVIVGSHVKKTTEQLAELKNSHGIEFVEFNQHLVLHPSELAIEVKRVVLLCEKCIRAGQTVVVYTRRERLDIGSDNKEEELKIAVKISDAITSIARQLTVRPNYIIAKGGITSSDIGVKGLEVKKALVAGQIKPGIPVWITGKESRFPGMPYIIFPGNVGKSTTLREAIEMLDNKDA